MTLNAGWSHLPVADASLEVNVRGSGEPVVFIQTALTADEFVPLARQPTLAEAYQVILYHRRGYAGSSPVQGLGSIERDASDCEALLPPSTSTAPTSWGCPTAPPLRSN